MQITNFREANAALESFIPRPYVAAEVYSLDTITKLMRFLGDPQNRLKIVHVAGTSGKTSTSYYAAALLAAAGHKVGLTVSPHVDELNERVQINMVPLDEKDFCTELSAFMTFIEAFEGKPTYYELLVAFMYWEFDRQRVDYAVVEVGLGGLVDGTNVAGRPDKVCIITDIGLDHTQVLGKTLAEIAAQKAGIIHRDNQVFMYHQAPEVMQVVERVVEKKQGTLNVIQQRGLRDQSIDLPLFQQRNLELALTAVTYVLWRDKQSKLTLEKINQAAHTYIPGRMETVQLPSGQLLIMDGAHNGQKISSFMQSLRAKYPDASIAMLTAFVQASDVRWKQGLELLASESDQIILTEFKAGQDIPRPSVRATLLRDYLAQKGSTHVRIIEDTQQALTELQAQKEDILLIVGSFHLLNALRPYILNR